MLKRLGSQGKLAVKQGPLFCGQVVRDQDHRPLGLKQLMQDRLAGRLVNRAGPFIDQKQLAAMHFRARQNHLLLLTAR